MRPDAVILDVVEEGVDVVVAQLDADFVLGALAEIVAVEIALDMAAIGPVPVDLLQFVARGGEE